MRYAVVLGGVVQTVVMWDGETQWAPPEGSEAIQCGDDVATGWLYDGVVFAAPQ